MTASGNKIFRTFFLWLPTIFYMAMIFYFSSLSKPVPYELPKHADKVIHILEYAILGFLMSYSIRNSGANNFFSLGVLFSSVYGMTDEIHQLFVFMRDASVVDVGADIIGSLVGVYCYRMIINRRMRWRILPQ